MKKAQTPGRRIGTKRRDMRWLAPDGTEWDSRFEFEVFCGYQREGYQVRKCGPDDRLPYTRAVRNAVCIQCASGEVVQKHTYTPDLHVGAADGKQREAVEAGSKPYFAECKGFLRPQRRSLLRAFCKAQPDVPLRLVLQRNYAINKRGTTIIEWATRFLKIPVTVWNGKPTAEADWIKPLRQTKKVRRNAKG